MHDRNVHKSVNLVHITATANNSVSQPCIIRWKKWHSFDPLGWCSLPTVAEVCEEGVMNDSLMCHHMKPAQQESDSTAQALPTQLPRVRLFITR